MTHSAVRRTATAAIAGLFLALGATASLAPAHADPDKDQSFIDYLDKKGVPYKNRTDIIRVAKGFCLDQTRQGVENWVPGYDLGTKQGWTRTELQNFISAAIPVYCPKVWGM